LFIHEHQREDGRELYGFQTFPELELADQLLTVSGVGPKIAQILVGLGVEKVRQAIRIGDVNLFLSISGIGKKRAQQIILELKGTIDTKNLDGSLENDEVAQALKQLGYGPREITDTLRKLPVGETEDRLRAALGMLGK
ncbi:MAG: Holliday junction branch migration protein RuvA, partial [bacterium]